MSPLALLLDQSGPWRVPGEYDTYVPGDPTRLFPLVPLPWLAWAAIGVLLLYWDRRAARPFSAWAVFGTVLVVLGGLDLCLVLNEIANSGAQVDRSFAPYVPTYALWAVAAYCGLVAWHGILRGRRRGAPLAACATLMPLAWGWMVYAAMIEREPMPRETRGVELATSMHATEDRPDTWPPTLRLTLEDGRTVLRPGVDAEPIGVEELDRVVAELAILSGTREDGRPVMLVVQRSAPAGPILEVLDRLRAADVWKVQYAMAFGERYPYIGKLSLRNDPARTTLDVRLTRDAIGPVLELGATTDEHEIRERLREEYRSGSSSWSLHVEPDVPWDVVVRALDELIEVGGRYLVLELDA